MVTTVGIVGTKGGTGKTSTAANLAGLLADMAYRVLLIDADPHASLSKYYALSYTAPCGIVEFLLGDLSDQTVASTISKTVYPNLDIVLSNDLSDDVRFNVQNRVDRALLVRIKMTHPIIKNNYDFVIIDTQGAVGPVQDAVAFASTMLITPVKPDVLSVREFIGGTQEALGRLSFGENMNLNVPPLYALIYAKDRTKDATMLTESIKEYFNQFVDGRQKLLATMIPSSKAYKESATMRVRVHFHERVHAGKSESALEMMTHLVFELFPVVRDQNRKITFFNEMQDLRPSPSEDEKGGAS